MAFRDADLVLAIGTKFSDRTYSVQTAPCKTCRVIHIDIDPTVFDKHGRERINIAGDAKKATQMLIDRLGGCADSHKPWDANIQDLKKRCKCGFNYDQDPILPQKIMYEINQITAEDPDDYIITTDVGQNQMWAMHYLKVERPRHFLSSGSFGTMGFGLPSAIGAKAARPDKKVMTITGDGGLQMVMQDIATSVAEDFPVVICLLNNGWLGMVRQWQKLFWNRRFSNTELKADPDFVKIAEAFGAKGIRVEKSGEVGDALKQAFDSDVTCLVEIMVDCEEDITPMIPANPAQALVKGRCKFQ